MTTTPRSESALEGILSAEVRRAGGMSVKLAPTMAGFPDRMVLWPGGRIDLVELKTKTGATRRIQEIWHHRAAKLGTDVKIIRGESELKHYLADRQQASVA